MTDSQLGWLESSSSGRSSGTESDILVVIIVDDAKPSLVPSPVTFREFPSAGCQLAKENCQLTGAGIPGKPGKPRVRGVPVVALSRL
ncbi:GD15557 [Drosophila simulans]|uniref:GD15557 n=1 Tax=Drosophila simulans TaxID=7240 RepID=B4R2V3_DROSI|nr:GD15557 [Drosophila simulans]